MIVPADEVPGLVADTPEAKVASSATALAIDDAVFVSYTSAGSTKATAIAAIAVELGIGVSEVMMVGDGHNDIDAMGAVGHGVAMGNADDRVKDAADHLVAGVDQDGLAEALELSTKL